MSIVAACAVPHPPLLIPGVGEDNDPQVQKTQRALQEVAKQIALLKPETLVFLSPHATLYRDYFHISPGANAWGNFSRFGSTAAYHVEYDEEFVSCLEALLRENNIPGDTSGEREPTLDHGVMVPLHFFDEAGIDAKIVRVGLSGLSLEQHRAFGKLVAETARQLGRKTIIVASGDLSHKLLPSGPYGFTPEGPEFDELMCNALATGDVESMLQIDEGLSDAAAECGFRSFVMMGGALEAIDFTPQLLSYEGPFGVGYAVAAYLAKDQGSETQGSSKLQHNDKAYGNETQDSSSKGQTNSEPQEGNETQHSSKAQGDNKAQCSITAQDDKPAAPSLPAALAKQALLCYFKNDRQRPTLTTPEIAQLLIRFSGDSRTKDLYQQLTTTGAGTFVSLHKYGDLRGCIGTISPARETTLHEIVHNAVSAAVEDPRFSPLEESELNDLTIKVDILGEAEPVLNRSTLDAERYGVIVSLGFRRGLLLPSLEGVDTPEEQIAIALSKARILPSEPYSLERFEVVRYS